MELKKLLQKVKEKYRRRNIIGFSNNTCIVIRPAAVEYWLMHKPVRFIKISNETEVDLKEILKEAVNRTVDERFEQVMATIIKLSPKIASELGTAPYIILEYPNLSLEIAQDIMFINPATDIDTSTIFTWLYSFKLTKPYSLAIPKELRKIIIEGWDKLKVKLLKKCIN